MSIQVKTIERGQPGVIGSGVKAFYAKIVFRGEASILPTTLAGFSPKPHGLLKQADTLSKV